MAADNVTELQKTEEKVRRGYADAAALYKGGFDAVIASNQAVIAGMQAVNGELLAFLQSRFKHNLATAKRFAECGSTQNAAEIQLDYARMSVQSYMDEFRRLSELLGKVTTDSFAPLKKGAEVAAEKATANLAA